jgi:hypothetical protein
MFDTSMRYQRNVWEEIFVLNWHGKIPIETSTKLPVGLREFFLKRTLEELKREAEAREAAQGS